MTGTDSGKHVDDLPFAAGIADVVAIFVADSRTAAVEVDASDDIVYVVLLLPVLCGQGGLVATLC